MLDVTRKVHNGNTQVSIIGIQINNLNNILRLEVPKMTCSHNISFTFNTHVLSWP